MQDEENNYCTSTFSDYACEFEKLRQKKILAEQAEMTSRRNESSSSSSRGNVPNPFPTTPISNASFARGRNLSVMNEHLKTQQLKKSGQLRSMPKCQPLDPHHVEGSGEVGTLQPSCINTTRVSLIAGSKPLTEKMKENCHNVIQQMEWPKGGLGRQELTREIPFCIAPAGPTWKATQESSNEVPLSVTPAGMNPTSKAVPRVQPVFNYKSEARSNEEKFKPSARNPSSRFSEPPVNKTNINTIPSLQRRFQHNPVNNTSGPTMNLQSAVSSSSLKSSVERENCKKKKLTEPHESSIVQSNEASSKMDENDDDFKELLQLANIKVRSSFEESKPKMLKRSKVAMLLEEGRVLVRSSVPHTPTHNLKDFPFDTYILEALRSMGFDTPKIIQAYVWEAILRGHHVSYVAGGQGGKTLGYLVPILNNLLDETEYSEVPPGCSPLVIVVCSSWENANYVQILCHQVMKKVKNFRSCVFADATDRSLQTTLPSLINGTTLLAATAPALSFLLEEGREVISFDRCCHLVFDDADILLKEHGEATKELFKFYQESVLRTSVKYFVPRQIVACANHWTHGMEVLSSRAMTNPSVFISSCMEAAVYGKMKLDVRRGTAKEMDCFLLQIVRAKLLSRTIIFCRGPAEVLKVAEMLKTVCVAPLLAHDQSVVSDLNLLTQRWNDAQPGFAVLVCTDDVLARLDIRNAETLIHYYIPHHSKYDFSYRLSFAMDNFFKSSSDAERPETHLLITKEFNNSLLTIVRFMQRFGLAVSDELATEAILSFCGKEVRKKSLPICNTLKAFGFCRNMKLCGHRHIITESLDQPIVPRNGSVRIRITAVHTATHYYARILKHRNEDHKLIDLSGPHFEIGAELRKHFRGMGEQIKSVEGRHVDIGGLYARSLDGIYERVRVESVLDKDHQKHPIEVAVFSVDHGCTETCLVTQLFELPDNLKNAPPEAVEIFLVGVKPLDRNTSWNEYATTFVREKIMSKELDGRIVLALSSSLWLQPLHERKRLDGVNSFVVLTDIRKEMLGAQLAEKNEEHMVKLYHLCETGGIILPDYSIGLAKKNSSMLHEVAHAFLPMHEETKIEVVSTVSPHEFYVAIVKFQETLQALEKDINVNISKCKSLTYEDTHLETLCIAESPSQPGTWCRAWIKKKIVEYGTWQFRVFFVDYGDYSTLPLNKLRTLPTNFINRLPFQAIACSLHGVGPKTASGSWTKEDIDFFVSLTRDTKGYMHELHAHAKFKEFINEVTKGPHYRISLINRQETEPQNLAEQMISQQRAIPLENDEDFLAAVRCSTAHKKHIEAEEMKKATRQAQQLFEDEDERKFDISPSWIEEFALHCSTGTEKNPNPQSSQTNKPADAVSALPLKKINPKPVADSDSSLTLIEHTMPLKDKASHFPTTKWWQNDENINITFFVDNVSAYNLELTEDHLSFLADVNGLRYELNTTTYSYIVPEKSSHSIVGPGVKVILRKQKVGASWTRLIIAPFKQPWLNYDFDHWISNDDDEEENHQEPMVEEKYAFETEQPDTSSSDSDEECGDERWLRDDD